MSSPSFSTKLADSLGRLLKLPVSPDLAFSGVNGSVDVGWLLLKASVENVSRGFTGDGLLTLLYPTFNENDRLVVSAVRVYVSSGDAKFDGVYFLRDGVSFTVGTISPAVADWTTWLPEPLGMVGSDHFQVNICNFVSNGWIYCYLLCSILEMS